MVSDAILFLLIVGKYFHSWDPFPDIPEDLVTLAQGDQEGEADKFGKGRTTRGRLAAGSPGVHRPTSPPPTAVQERPTLSSTLLEKLDLTW